MEKHLIWVIITGGILGFTPQEIITFERHFKASRLDQEDYWPMFTWFFQQRRELTRTQDPHGFSMINIDPVAWMKLNQLRRTL